MMSGSNKYIVERLNKSTKFEMIINRVTNKVDKIALGDTDEIKIGDRLSPLIRVYVSSFIIFRGSIVDLNKFVVNHDDKIKTKIKLSNGCAVIYDGKSWLYSADDIYDEEIYTDSFGEIIEAYRKFITKLKEHNVSTVVITCDNIYTSQWLRIDDFKYLSQNLSKNGIVIFFVVKIRRKPGDETVLDDEYMQNNSISCVHIDYSLSEESFFSQIKRHLDYRWYDNYENFFQKLIGEKLLHLDRYDWKDPVSGVNLNPSDKEFEFELNLTIDLGDLIQRHVFESIRSRNQIELMIVEKLNYALPHEILHISKDPCDKYNTLLLPQYDINISSCIYDNPHVQFKKTMIYNFTNYNKYVCRCVNVEECTNICAITDDTYNTENFDFAKCLVDSIHEDKDKQELHKNIIVYTFNQKVSPYDYVMYRDKNSA